MAYQIPEFGDRQYNLGPSARVPQPRGGSTESPSGNADRGRVQHSTSPAPERPPPVPPKPGQTRHNRSMSHPFHPMPNAADGPSSSYLGQANLPDERRDGRTMVRQMDSGSRKVGGGSGRNFATGNCMTCGGLVRWPSNLAAFKCTTCATVNDLESADDYDPTGASRRDGSASGGIQKNTDFGQGAHIRLSAKDLPTLMLH